MLMKQIACHFQKRPNLNSPVKQLFMVVICLNNSRWEMFCLSKNVSVVIYLQNNWVLFRPPAQLFSSPIRLDWLQYGWIGYCTVGLVIDPNKQTNKQDGTSNSSKTNVNNRNQIYKIPPWLALRSLLHVNQSSIQ